MRSLFVAVAVLGLAIALLSRNVLAEPPPEMESRELKLIIDALRLKPALQTELASARFAHEVLGTRSLPAPVGSTLETLGPWGDNGALLGSEIELSRRACGALPEAELKAASAILAEYAEKLPVTLRAYTLGQQGKKSQAAELFVTFIDQQQPATCQREHPMYSHRRAVRISFALQCLKVMTPARNVSKQQQKLEQALSCAKNNHAVG